MRTFLWSILLIVLVGASAGVTNARGKSLGWVVAANDALVDNDSAVGGTNLYAEDVLTTGPSGSMLLKVGACQIALASDSEVTLKGQEQGTGWRIKVDRGAATFSSSQNGALELETPLGIVRRTNDAEAAYGQVRVTSQKEVIVSANRGDLIFESDGESHPIPAGKGYRIVNEAEGADPQGPAGYPASGNNNDDNKNNNHHKKRKLAFYIVFASAIEGTSYVIWNAITESPSAP